MEDKDLEIANKRAGHKFRGQMRQVFGILKEKDEASQQQRGQTTSDSNSQNLRTRKRGAQTEEQSNKRQK